MTVGNIELLVSVNGQDKLSATLGQAQRSMRKLGKATQETAQRSGAFGKVALNLKTVNLAWTEMNSKISLVSTALQAPLAIYNTIINRLKSGEIAGNADIIFRQMHDQAQNAMDRMNEVTRGIMTETDIQQLANQMELLGATTDQQVKVLEVATKMKIATGKDMSATAERLVTAVISGRTSSLKMLGVTIDLKKATEDYALSQGKTTAELSKADQIYARLGATVDHLNSKFDGIDFDSLMMDAHKTDTAFENMISNMETLAAGADLASAKTRELRGDFIKIADELDARRRALADVAELESLEKGRVLANEIIEEIGQGSIDKTKELMQTLVRTLDFSKAEYSQLWDAFQVTTQRDLDRMVDIVSNAARRLKTVYTENVGELRRMQAEADAESAMRDAFYQEQEKHEKEQEAKSSARKKAWAQKRASERAQSLREVLRLEKAQHDASRTDAEIESARHQAAMDEIARIWNRRADKLNRAKEAESYRHTTEMAKISAAEASKAAENAAADLDRRHREQMLMAEMDTARAMGAGDEARIRAEHRLEDLRLRQSFEAGEIDATQFHIERLIEMERRRTEAEREQHEARQRLREDQLAASAAIGAEIQSLSQQNGNDFAAVAGAMSAGVSEVARNWKGLQSGAPAAIAAIGQVAEGSIRSDRAMAVVKGGIATAQSIAAFASGNIPSGISFAAAAAAFFAVGGKGGSSAKAAPATESGLGGSAIQSTGDFSTVGGSLTVNVQGFVGSQLDLANEIGKAQNENRSAGMSDAEVY